MEAVEAKRRGYHDITTEILKTAVGGAIKTHVMYKAKLSYAQLNRYLPLLIENGLLEERSVQLKRGEIGQLYITTPKGHRFVGGMEGIYSMWNGKKENNGQSNESPIINENNSPFSKSHVAYLYQTS